MEKSREGNQNNTHIVKAVRIEPPEVDEYYLISEREKVQVLSLEDDNSAEVLFQNEKYPRVVNYFDDWELLPYEKIKNQIIEVREQNKRPFLIKKEVASLVIESLCKHGFFAWSNEESYYFRNKDHKLFSVNSIAFQAFVEFSFGLNSTEIEYKYLIESIKAYAYREKTVTVYNFCFYNRYLSCLYISSFDGMMYRLNGYIVESVPNGTDGILFIDDPSWESFEYLGQNIRSGYVSELLVDTINFTLSTEVLLLPSEQRGFWLLNIFSLFFESLLPTKPLTLFLGQKGSGKTSTLSWILSLFFGSKVRVLSMGKDKEDAFLASICNEYLVVYDNVDGKILWLNDHLAAVATGSGIIRRKLYTTNEKSKMFPRVFIFLTSRTPNFKRDDLADRMLIFNVETFKEFKSEEQLRKERADKRNELMTELLNDLNTIVQHLKTDGNPEFKTNHRMADWAKLVCRIGRVVGVENKIILALEKLQHDQSEFLLGDEPIAQALELWTGIPGYEARSLTAKELLDELGSAFPEIRSTYRSPKSLAQKLTHIEKNLKIYYEIKTEKEEGKAKTYSFSKRK
ncbi:MAG: hypothetical protein A2536_06440 [Candidatus Firestonebacteria bacterium RIFOXYD2_FULL_39_29]|nr:MAG: hypothetical protein A2536_06440 [Candidatus Firestonebacteria bacterium RIFOXYD2_FULL_39_29]